MNTTAPQQRPAPPIYRSAEGERAVMVRYEMALARWPVPHTTTHVATRHGATFVIASGDDAAPPLVLLHGAGSNAAMWAGEIAAYSRHHRVFALDLPGEPGKSAPLRPPWEGSAYAEWLEDAFDALGLDATAVVGLSQGAWVALKFAVANPERVNALALLSPGGIVPDKLGFVLRALPLSLLGGWGRVRIVRLVIGGQPVPTEVKETILLLLRHFRPRLGVLPLFSDEELARLRMPVQLVMGAHDALRDAERIAARLRGRVPQLTATILPAAGHALAGASAHVLPFLDALTPAVAR